MTKDTQRLLIRLLLAALVVVVLIGVACLVQVRPGTVVIVTRLGEPVAVLDTPGPNIRLPPPIERAIVVPVPLRTTASGQIRTILADGTSLVIEAYALWRVDAEQAIMWLRSTSNDPDRAADLLRTVIASALQTIGGSFRIDHVVNLDPQAVALDEFRTAVLDEVRQQIGQRYGVELVDLGFERLQVPPTIVDSTLNTMAEERLVLAERTLAAGRAEVAGIEARADEEARTLLAAAQETATTTIAEATVEANRIYAETHDVDPELYRFLRQLTTLEQSLGSQTRLILSTESAPLHMLGEGAKDMLEYEADDER